MMINTFQTVKKEENFLQPKTIKKDNRVLHMIKSL